VFLFTPIIHNRPTGHAIKRWLYSNTVSYFMRLPDGSPQGTGYVATAEQSLKRLHEGAIRTMTSIDNSTTYLSRHYFRIEPGIRNPSQ
jgi:hypothetical protein